MHETHARVGPVRIGRFQVLPLPYSGKNNTTILEGYVSALYLTAKYFLL